MTEHTNTALYIHIYDIVSDFQLHGLGLVTKQSKISYWCLFLQLLAQWQAHISSRMFSKHVNEWITRESVFAFTLKWILPTSQDCKHPTDHGAIHSISKCCQPAHGSNQEETWFMLPMEWAREMEFSTTDLSLSPWKLNMEGKGGMKNDLRTTPITFVMRSFHSGRVLLFITANIKILKCLQKYMASAMPVPSMWLSS